MKNWNVWSGFTLLIALLTAAPIWAADDKPAAPAVLAISGIVKNPQRLTLEDLGRLQTVTVQANEVDRQGRFHGFFQHRAVPLKTLLDMAHIQKEASDFAKPIDVAIRVRDRQGRQVVLSWGEVYYSNPAEVTIALSADPVIPRHPGDKAQLATLQRRVGLPKLLLTGDFYTERYLEDVVSIEVMDLHPDIRIDRSARLYSDSFRIDGLVGKPLELKDLSRHPQIEVHKKLFGGSHGFRGLHRYRGVPLVKLLEQAGVQPDLDKAVLVSAPDGYRALFAMGELFLSPEGRRIIVATAKNGQSFKDSGGKFTMIVPDELTEDRDIQAVVRIEVVDLRQPGKLYIIGVGPGDTDLITLEALSALARVDVMAAPADIVKRFGHYLRGKENLFDPLQFIRGVYRRQQPDLPEEQLDEMLARLRAGEIKKLKEVLADGRSIAFMDWGDPMIYGSSRWVREYFNEDQIVTIPAMSSFNAANAVINRDITGTGSIIISGPEGLRQNELLLQAAAANGETMALFLAMWEFEKLVPLLQRYYDGQTPVALVYSAGIAGSEKLVRTNLNQAANQVRAESEKTLGLVYIGPRLVAEGMVE